MISKKFYQEALVILCTLLPVCYLFVNWGLLPESVPIHFDGQGNPNGYGSRWVYVIMPVGLYFLMLVLPKIDPRRSNYTFFEDSYYKLRLIMALFIGFLDTAIIYSIVNNANSVQKLLPISIFFLLMLIGNYMGNFRPNYFVGIKVPWTLNSDEVWIRTHKMAGKLWFWGSLAGIVLFLIIDKFEWVLIPLLIVMVVVPIVYSYVIYQNAGDKRA